MSMPIVIRTGVALFALASMDCFSCFTARSVLTDYPAREKQPVHPIGGPLSLDLEIIAQGKADENAMPTIASTAMLKTAEQPSGIPALIRSSVVFSAGGREAICRRCLDRIDFNATKCN
jgi:hypothetical protein